MVRGAADRDKARSDFNRLRKQSRDPLLTVLTIVLAFWMFVLAPLHHSAARDTNIVGFLLALAVAGALLVLSGRAIPALLMLFGLTPLPSSLSVIFVIPMTGLLFAAIGMVFSLRIPNIDMFSFYFTLFLTPLFLFSDVFFPLKERLAGAWLWVAEALPLLHPVRLARASFRGEFSAIVFWDLAYTLGMSLLLLLWARRSVRDRLTN